MPHIPALADGEAQASHRPPPWLAALACLFLLTLVVVMARFRGDNHRALAREGLGVSLWVEADGDRVLHQTQAQTVADALAEMRLSVHAHDRIEIGGRAVALDAPLEGLPAMDRLVVHRAAPFILEDGGLRTKLYATKRAVGDALWEAGVQVYAGDRVYPALDAPLYPGMRVSLHRSKSLTIISDEEIIRTRTHQETIGQALAQEGIDLAGQDYCDPPPDNAVGDGQQVYISRIAEEWIVEPEAIPYQVVWQADSQLELDRQSVAQTGQEGVRKRRYRITYENGREVNRLLEEEWVDQEPRTRILTYGTKIVLRTIDTLEGPKRYWRHLRVLATSYTAATCGKEPDHPEYGITFLGWQAGKGIIAVDPRVIPLRAHMYVPGYGLGVAGDTGGAIKGRRIDLGYDEHNLVLWYRWVDVYLLEPVPPSHNIPWTLPNWPQER